MKKAVFLVLMLLALSPLALTSVMSTYEKNISNVVNTAGEMSSINIYAELANIYIGKRGGIAYTLFYAGGNNVEMPINYSWPELEGLYALRIGAGVGVRWWLYYHHDIYPEIPPMITLAMVYELPESQAVSKALSLADKIGQIYNLTFKPFWSWEDTNKGETAILFTAEGGVSGNATYIGNFMINNIISRVPNEGLGVLAHSSVVIDNINNGIYARASFTLIRDTEDVDNDTDTFEFIPVIVVASVAGNAFIKMDNGWWRFSLREAMNINTNISAASFANYSVIKIKSPLPMELYEPNSTVPINPMYEYTGTFLYVLKTPDYYKSYDDIVLVVKPFDFSEELSIIPFVTPVFYIANMTLTTYNPGPYLNYNAFNITMAIALYNGENGGTAYNITIALPIVGDLRRALDIMSNELNNAPYSEFLKGDGWSFKTIEIDGRKTLAFVYHLDNLSANSTFTTNISLLLIPDILGESLSLNLYFPVGPLVFYSDAEGKKYFVMANGFAMSMKAGIFLVSVLLPTGFEIVNETEMLFRFNFALSLIVFAGHDTMVSKLSNISAYLAVSKPEKIMTLRKPRILNQSYVNSMSIEPGEENGYTFELSFTSRLKAGAWAFFGGVSFNLNVNTPTGTRSISLFVATNSWMFYVPPAPWIIERWLREQKFPYPHVELDVNKIATYDNTTGELVISINITNIGDTETKINIYEVLLTEYINESAGNNGILEVTVNGTTIEPYVEVKEDLGVLVVAVANIQIKPGETVTIQIRVKMNTNYSGEIVIRPTIIEYNFGKYAPEQTENEEDAIGESQSAQEEEHESGKLLNNILAIKKKAFHIMQGEEENPLSTYSNAIIATIMPPSGTTGGGTGTTGGGRIWGILIFVTILASIIAAVYIVVSKRHS